MPWNQPGGDDKDPWSGGPRKQGPPDLDELLKKFTGGLGKFGGGKGKGNGKSPGAGGFILLAIVALAFWLASGFFIVGAGERGLILQFGKFKTVKNPGLGWHIPRPIQSVEKVNIDQVREYPHRTTMLTKDENIVDISLAIQYRIKDPVDYQFNVRSPDVSLQEAVESALREAVGKNIMDFVLVDGRPEVALRTRELTQQILDQYGTGLEVTTVNLQGSQPPDEVQDAFNDAIKAREDKERFVNEAQAYSNSIIPMARGESARVTAEAAAYKEQVIAQSEGDASRFSQLLTEYKKAPDVTRKRLYLETVEDVLANTSKVMIDSKQGNSLMYLPLDKLMSQGQSGSKGMNQPSSSLQSMPVQRNSGSTTRQPLRGMRESR
ncbi:MAG TPA: FtsH protease activity modulator HflK [Chromatiales bacterium]|nr:FtsH protease activity modulator HflK [Thiotrichales bacterium]HIP69374.1 FtsH protease activity modulator HflK [Chromatiales bacterium]